jgi:hypothetical protein
MIPMVREVVERFPDERREIDRDTLDRHCKCGARITGYDPAMIKHPNDCASCAAAWEGR